MELSPRGERLAERVFGREREHLRAHEERAGLARSRARSGPDVAGDDASERVRAEFADAALERARRESGRETRAAPPEVDAEAVRELRQLQRSDRQVRLQENLKRQMGAEHVRGGAEYSFVEGPDGRRYAVSASSEFELPDANTDPRQAAHDAAQIRRAVLAAARSSPADRALAARATSLEARARAEIPVEPREPTSRDTEDTDRDRGSVDRAA
ncbi:hypothetical protein [Planctomycetes bacterium Pla163]|uniref:hypothetical protein n=1 Tax=Rohdeia mirabilis TaxID=2528008 RepID=UPI0011A6605E